MTHLSCFQIAPDACMEAFGCKLAWQGCPENPFVKGRGWAGKLARPLLQTVACRAQLQIERKQRVCHQSTPVEMFCQMLLSAVSLPTWHLLYVTVI